MNQVQLKISFIIFFTFFQSDKYGIALMKPEIMTEAIGRLFKGVFKCQFCKVLYIPVYVLITEKW